MLGPGPFLSPLGILMFLMFPWLIAVDAALVAVAGFILRRRLPEFPPSEQRVLPTVGKPPPPFLYLPAVLAVVLSGASMAIIRLMDKGQGPALDVWVVGYILSLGVKIYLLFFARQYTWPTTRPLFFSLVIAFAALSGSCAINLTLD